MAREYLKISKFGGIDERKLFSQSLFLSPDMNNFTVNSEGHLVKRNGSRKASCDFNGSIYRIWSGYADGKQAFIACTETRIYEYNFDENRFVSLNVTSGKCRHIFSFGNAVYFLCDGGYYKYKDGVYSSVSPYIPQIAVSCLPDGSGTAFEKLNMLTGKKRMLFSADGTSKTFTLAEKNIDHMVWVKLNGEQLSAGWSGNIKNGTVTFTEAPEKGINNLEICWSKNSTAKPDMIYGCTEGMCFGGNTDTRVFLYGHPDYPNYRFYSELADGIPSAEYFPETNYTVIGTSSITDMVQQYDRQLIFTEDRAYYSYCELRTDTFGNYYPSFPVYNLNFEKGNLLKGSSAVIDNTPVTLSDNGLNRWVSTTVQDERNAVCFSQPIEKTVKRILCGRKQGECCLYDRQSAGELYFSTPYGLFIYNYDHNVWYKYDAVNAVQFCELYDKLYWLNSDGELYYYSPTLTNDENGAVTAYWTTPTTRFGAQSRRFDLKAVEAEVCNSNGTELTVTVAPSEAGQLMNSGTITADESGGVKLLKFRTELKRSAGGKVTISSSHNIKGCEIAGLIFKTNGKEAYR